MKAAFGFCLLHLICEIEGDTSNEKNEAHMIFMHLISMLNCSREIEKLNQGSLGEICL